MTIATQPAAAKESGRGSPVEVLLAFLKLGLTCFGGPIAHIGYFREEFVVRRRWLDEHAYADLVGLCQFLPGPASSQVGFSIGLMRAGYLGGLAAWTGFTLPSAIALVLFAYGATALSGPIGVGLIHGLKLVAVAIVAQAVWGMARVLCPDRARAAIAVAAALVILLFSTSPVAQIAAIALGGCRGVMALSSGASDSNRTYRRAGVAHCRNFGACCFLSSARRPSDAAEPRTMAGRSAVRSILSVGGFGLRRRSCRTAAATRSVRDTGLDKRRCVPRGLWRRTGDSRAAIFVRRLSWRRRASIATRAYSAQHWA